MNTLSFNTANLVARQLNYKMPGGWGQGDTATNDYFCPLATFSERFDAMLAEIAALDFNAIDLWVAHLNYNWATPEHIEIARRLLAKHKLRVVSYAGGFGCSVPAGLVRGTSTASPPSGNSPRVSNTFTSKTSRPAAPRRPAINSSTWATRPAGSLILDSWNNFASTVGKLSEGNHWCFHRRRIDDELLTANSIAVRVSDRKS